MFVPLHLAISLLLAPAVAQEPTPDAYKRLVEHISTLYLEPSEVTPEAMLATAADDLSDHIDWLLIEVDGGHVSLRDGAGEPLGEVHVASWEDLPDALYGLERIVGSAGHDLRDVDLRHATLGGATDALDRYTNVLVGDGLTRFDTRLKGTLVGIGARLGIRNEQLTILSVFPDSPAERGLMQANDWVVRIDGESTTNMPVNEAVRRIRGEKGTEIVLDVLRANDKGEPTPLNLTLSRDEVVLPNVEHAVLAEGVGYVRIDHISQQTVYNLRHEMQKLHDQHALNRGLIIDLRGNSGGSMKESAAVVDMFVEEGLLLLTVGHDGGPVRNLAHRIEAKRQGDEPPKPVIVLVDRKTASGAEIISGSLLALDRAVILGQRTYGKGLVQKIYKLDDVASLKITVAEYVLEHDMRVRPNGIQPDVTFGEIVLRKEGVRYEDGWDLERERTEWDAIVPIVHERADWQGTESEPGDVVLEVARQAILASGDNFAREDVLAAVHTVLPAQRSAQETHLAQALESRGIDWTAAPGPGAQPEADVTLTLTPHPSEAGTYTLHAHVLNHGPTTLYRTIVRVTCNDFGWWDDLVIPVGAVASGAEADGEVSLTLSHGLLPRSDAVGIELRAHQRPPLHLPGMALASESTPEPPLRVTATLAGTGANRTANVEVTNLSNTALRGVEAEFAYPSDLNVELTDHASRRPLLAPHDSVTFSLGMRVGDELPADLPMRLRLESDDWGRLLNWELPLPTNGEPVSIQAPQIAVNMPTALTVGPQVASIVVSDERALTSIVVFLNGDKVLWHPGGADRIELSPNITIKPGPNRLSIRARDDQDIVDQRTWTILGVDDEGITGDTP